MGTPAPAAPTAQTDRKAAHDSAPVEPTATATPPDSEAAKIYMEQEKLEGLLDKTVDVSGDSSGEDEIPEETLLNTSTESVSKDSTKTEPIANNSEAGPNKSSELSIATKSETESATSSVPIATNSEGEEVATITAGAPPAMEGISTGNSSIPVPSEYYAIQNAWHINRTMPNINGGFPAEYALPGKFFATGDSRENIKKGRL